MTTVTAPGRQEQQGRRHFLVMGLSCAGALYASRLLGASSDGAGGVSSGEGLITRAIPATGQRLPVIGLGARDFGIGELAELRTEIRRMVELGGAIIDTAASYGLSEQLIGQVIAELGVRDRIFLATKLTGGPPSGGFGSGRPGGVGAEAPRRRRGGGTGGFSGSPVYGQASLERSLQRLRTDHLDLLQVHNLDGVEALWPLMAQWKRAGKVRYIGMTTSFAGQHPQLVELMRRYPVDFIEVDYSIGNRDAAVQVLPLAAERRVAVLADVPLGGAGRGGFSLADVLKKPLPALAAEVGARDWPQLMLKYVISHPAVTAAIPGSIKVEHLEDDQAAGRGHLLDAAMRRSLEQYWDRLVGV